jgi:hypothetical protein
MITGEGGGREFKQATLARCPCKQKLVCSRKIPLTIYKRDQFLITELEIGVVDTDFSRRTSWWAREDQGRAGTWKQ